MLTNNLLSSQIKIQIKYALFIFSVQMLVLAIIFVAFLQNPPKLKIRNGIGF